MISNTFKRRFKHYLPAIISILLGLFFLAVPVLAVLLVFGAFTAFGFFYAMIVNRFHKMQDAQPRYQSDTFDSDAYPAGQEPNFKNVTLQVFRFDQFSDRTI